MRLRLVGGRRTVDVEGGRIVPPGGAPRLVLDIEIEGAEVRPGLVNAHDHLHRNHLPRLGHPPYPNVYAWGDDLHDRFAPELARREALPRRQALLFGALKNLLGGVTTAVHHDPWDESFGGDFPIRVPRLRAIHTLRLDGAAARAAAGNGELVSLHLAEGTDSASAEEVREADRIGLLGRNLLAVHLVGTDADGVERLARSGAAAVWCPTSNLFLYGKTAPVPLLSSATDVLLGTDALVSGEGTLLHELAAARALGLLPDDRLEAAVTLVAAARLGLPRPSLSPGAPADLVVLRRPLLSAQPRDVALVLVAGRPALADEALGDVFPACGVTAEPITVGGVQKRVVAPLGRLAEEVFAETPACSRILE